MQPAPVFKGCWVPSPALSGSHKGLSSVEWEGMTLEDFGSVCLCVYAAGLPLCAYSSVYRRVCVRCFCIPVRMLVFAYDYILYVHLCSSVHARWGFLLFSHSGTLSSKRCASQSAERERKTRSEAGRGLRTGIKNGWMQKSGARVRSFLLWTMFQMFVHCKYCKHNIAGTSKIMLAFSWWQVYYAQLTFIHHLFDLDHYSSYSWVIIQIRDNKTRKPRGPKGHIGSFKSF